MRSAMIVGGANGLGLSLATKLSEDNFKSIYIIDKNPPIHSLDKFKFIKTNLVSTNFDFIHDIIDEIDTVYITAGIGRLSFFSDVVLPEIDINFNINTLPTIKIAKIFYKKLKSKNKFTFVVITSIAGFVSSPLYSLYSATKASLCNFISSINAELEYHKTNNKILNVAPGHINGTRFHGGETDLSMLERLTDAIIESASLNKSIYIPDYEKIYKNVLRRNFEDNEKFSRESLLYKLENNDLEIKPKMKIGYLSGTFDLFHIGHLNLLKRAKEYCDYLIVGVHKDGSHKEKDTAIPFEERKSIVSSIKYVDKVITSLYEDSDVYEIEHYDYLFVGSDYKGSERFTNYENILSPKGVKIVYFPYTNNTSSTKLRDYLSKK